MGVKMKAQAALILLSVLTSAIMASPFEKNIDISVKPSTFEGRAAEVPSASSRFFFPDWCQIYKGNCVNGCSTNSCDAVCTVSSWLATCTYQCGETTSLCQQTDDSTAAPTDAPSDSPSDSPSAAPSVSSSAFPSVSPSASSSASPSPSSPAI